MTIARRLLLLRHAEAEKGPGQSARDLFSVGDRGLSDAGRAEARAAERIVGRFGVDAVYASPARRAIETAEIVSGGRAPRIEPGLAEWAFATPGADYATILARIHATGRALRDEADPRLPGGELVSEARRRFRSAVEAALARHESPLVVAHGVANRAFLADILGMPAHRMFRLAQDHGAVNVVAYEEGVPTVLHVNLREG